MKKEFVNKITRTASNLGFKLRKHSPAIFITVGVAGVVVSAVMACKATTKLEDIIDDSKADINDVNDRLEDAKAGIEPDHEEGTEIVPYTEEAAAKDLAVIYAKTGLKVAKLYAPSVILGALSLTCIITSNTILHKRNAALSAAYMTIDKSFKEYRGRVAKRFGDEIEKQIRYNIQPTEIEETVENKNGETVTEKKTVNVAHLDGYSDYAVIFDAISPYYSKNPLYNQSFLKAQQSIANDMLRARGRLFLNEVLEMLGLPKTKTGQIVGWVYNKDCPTGDNYVDFGIYDMWREKVKEFVDGHEPVIILDFNVDGDVWSSM